MDLVSHDSRYSNRNDQHYLVSNFLITCNKTMIEIYGKPQCPFCDKAKALCEQRGYAYSYLSLGTDFTTEELFETFPTARTFPQIRVDEVNIGGYTELREWADRQIGDITI